MAIKVVEKMKNKQIVYGTVINYATVFVQMISTVVVTPYLIKIFGDNDYGIYKIIVSLAAYFYLDCKSQFSFSLYKSHIKSLHQM